MIKNTRQLAVAQRKAQALLEALRSTEGPIERATYSQLIADLHREIHEFEEIRNGLVREFAISSADDIGPAVIKARIASGLNQRQLAEVLEVSEQAVQRDEAGEYERASVARLAEIIDALGHELVGVLRPTQERLPVVANVEYPPAFQGRVRPAPSVSTRQNDIQSQINRFQHPAILPSTMLHPLYSYDSAANSLTVRVGAGT